MTKEEAIKLLSQIMDALLVSNSWLPSTDNPIKESFSMAISALQAQENCNNLTTDIISRKAAIEEIEFGITYAKAINKETGEVKELFQKGNNELKKAVERVKALPSEQLRPKGKWIHGTYYGEIMPEHKCSECETWEYSDEESNFCSYCGADMRSEVEA